MTTHSSVLAWRIPRTEDLAGCSQWGHGESDTAERLSPVWHCPCATRQALTHWASREGTLLPSDIASVMDSFLTDRCGYHHTCTC